MKGKEPHPNQALPPIPDYPESPLPAWKHYGITNYADQKIQEELDHTEYPGYMVGLELAYTVGRRKSYAMAFGKIDIPENMLEDPEQEVPLSDEFLADLYGVVNDLIINNIPGFSGNMTAQITVVVSKSPKKYTQVQIKCRKPEYCPLGHRDKRLCRKVNKGKWTCVSGHPKCGKAVK